MDLVAVGVFAGALVLNAGTPGPSIAALVSRVISDGWRDVVPFTLALWLGEVLWLTVALAGLTTVAARFHLAFVALKWAGVAYLCWLAIKMWRARPDTVRDSEVGHIPLRRSGISMFAAGIALTLGNPKIMVFYVAFLPSLVDMSEPALTTWLVLALVTAAVLAVVDGTWMVLASRLREMLRSPRAVRTANRISAVTMGGAAGAIASR